MLVVTLETVYVSRFTPFMQWENQNPRLRDDGKCSTIECNLESENWLRSFLFYVNYSATRMWSMKCLEEQGIINFHVLRSKIVCEKAVFLFCWHTVVREIYLKDIFPSLLANKICILLYLVCGLIISLHHCLDNEY